jgi:hypothetical protein
MKTDLKRRELLAYVGDYSQVMGIKDYIFNSGKAKGVRAFDIKNSKGLELTVLADKSIDIPYLSYKGINIGFTSKTGITAPEFYSENGSRGFMQNFDAGFLTTGGLTYMGSACEDEGESLGLHGPISNTPAEEVCASTEWVDDTAYMKVTGKMRQACVLGEYVMLERELIINSAENKILIKDRVENRGFRMEPLMLLYHINFGYPFLNKCTKLYSDLEKIIPRDDESAKGIYNCFQFERPIEGFEEQVFSHITDNKEKVESTAIIHNEELGIAVTIKFDPTRLPWLNHWKCPRAGDYVLGVEPGNCHVAGRKKAREEGNLKFINAGEVKYFELEIKFFDNREEVDALISSIK